MIQKLKRKFILLSATSLLVLLTVIVAGMNIINYNSVVEEADSILSVLSQNKGMFPEFKPNMGGKPDDRFPHGFSPETPFESRYFSVLYNEDGELLLVDVSRISAIDEESAIELAQSIDLEAASKGFMGEYRYAVDNDFDMTRITFLDCGRKLDAFQSFLISSILMSVIGFSIVCLIISILAGRIIKPIAESYEKQKRFITDAGHEIKTPLTIINANVDILDMEFEEENESLRDIKDQTRRLRSLTEDLVMLSRMEESEESMEKIEFPISEVVTETIQSFKPLIAYEKKELLCNIESMLTLNGNDKAIRQLVSILLDNAIKYSKPDSKIEVTLSQQNHSLVLSVCNEATETIQPEQLHYVFDRFYRTDESRNSQTGGHGIGLSIAKAIVTAHNGKIKASTKAGNVFVITATFPNK